MKMPRRLAERLIALSVAAAVLFLPPMVTVLDRANQSGPSLLALYLFAVWALVIGLAAWLLEQRSGE